MKRYGTMALPIAAAVAALGAGACVGDPATASASGGGAATTSHASAGSGGQGGGTSSSTMSTGPGAGGGGSSSTSGATTGSTTGTTTTTGVTTGATGGGGGGNATGGGGGAGGAMGCVENETRCADPMHTEVCGQDGMFHPDMTCAPGEACTNGVCAGVVLHGGLTEVQLAPQLGSVRLGEAGFSELTKTCSADQTKCVVGGIRP